MPAQPPTEVPDVITVGRVSVDLYAQEVNASFTDPQTSVSYTHLTLPTICSE